MPAPCAHVYNRLPPTHRPDFFKLYARMKCGPHMQGLNSEFGGAEDFASGTDLLLDTFSSEVMVAMILTKLQYWERIRLNKRPPPTEFCPITGRPLPGPRALITLPARQLQPNMKRLSIQLDSQAYYSCCKVDKICPELELGNWVEILKTFSVEHGRFGKTAAKQGPI
eukprot:g10721.t1